MLLANVLVVAACALVYELLCGTLASYLLGNAVFQFSLVLGVYLAAMGAGAWVARAFEAEAPARYVQAELALAIVGGLSVPGLLLVVAADGPLRLALYAVVFAIGALVGLELPLLVRILRDAGAARSPTPGGELHDDVEERRPGNDDAPSPATAPRFGDIVARALAFDYLGALAASLLFPLVLMPHLGLVRTSVLTGVLNAVVAIAATFVVEVRGRTTLRLTGVAVLGVLGFAFVRAEGWVATVTD